MIEIPLPWLFFGLPAAIVLGAVGLHLLANHYHRRGYWAARDKHAPTLPAWRPTPREVQELFDGIRNAIPVDDAEMERAKPLRPRNVTPFPAPRRRA